eukprot:3981070-Ditylum_brightwellii.AAC.1
MNATKYSPLDWEYKISGIAGQSEESLGEQKLVPPSLKEKVDKYRRCEIVGRCATILHGFPGSGKTYMRYVFALYCISKGLFVANTSVAARHSHQIGGYYLAKLFHIFGDRGSTFEYEGGK